MYDAIPLSLRLLFYALERPGHGFNVGQLLLDLLKG